MLYRRHALQSQDGEEQRLPTAFSHADVAKAATCATFGSQHFRDAIAFPLLRHRLPISGKANREQVSGKRLYRRQWDHRPVPRCPAPPSLVGMGRCRLRSQPPVRKMVPASRVGPTPNTNLPIRARWCPCKGDVADPATKRSKPPGVEPVRGATLRVC
jgi:hypothetical protein